MPIRHSRTLTLAFDNNNVVNMIRPMLASQQTQCMVGDIVLHFSQCSVMMMMFTINPDLLYTLGYYKVKFNSTAVSQ